MTDHNRETFEQFIFAQPFYAHRADEDDILERDQDGGYLDSCVHGAWLAWNAHGTLPVRSSPDVDAVRWGGKVIICHPGMPPHVWDGERMMRVAVSAGTNREERANV
ncbi:hypothetical protein EOS93_25275 [Rhizobium sp. RMa-01]|uniref:hypothetical protein n=1 Tax=unclassified Rhizobium TaxID=2613769 RepID=UPI0008D93F96|nr:MULTISPECIES: hypothetical protein [unclassified Rhizobium]OHV24929.1 hypothetical protein BBJ66_22560 [Rhizobium sp. RSm-3]RVU08363.1 hypothetical protein EOS93_25275 [Rhizobium sp. RMa-01]